MSRLIINGVVWQSTLTEEMIAHLSENEISMLINTLNDSVEQICSDYEIKEQEKVKMTTYFATDGNYGNADGIVIVDTSDWSEENWTAIDEVGDADRANLAYTLANPACCTHDQHENYCDCCMSACNHDLTSQ